MVLRPKIIDESKALIDKALCFLHDRFADNPNGGFTKDQLISFLSTKNIGAATIAVDELTSGTYAVGWYHLGNNHYKISRNGIEYVDSWSSDRHQSAAKWVSVLDTITTDSAASIPASDRAVTLNHNQSDYQQAVAALDRVLAEFRNDHRLDNELGPQKEAHLKVLEGGRTALEDKEITVENGHDWIIKPLKWIGEKFADGALKVLAAKALELILNLLGPGN